MTMMMLALISITTTVGDDQNWPGFRGDGTSQSSAKNVPLEWSPTNNIAWRVELPGYGQSAPVVWGDKVFVTTVTGENKERYSLLAFDATTGKQLWKDDFTASQPSPNNAMMSRAAPTPLVDSKSVYAFFEGGDMVALDHDGTKQWERSFVKDYGKFENRHGLGSSPVQTSRSIIQVIDNAGPSYILAISKTSGKTLWKVDRPSQTGWCTPIVVKQGEQELILVSSSGKLDAYDAMAGELLWTHEGLTGNQIISPTVIGDRIVMGAGLTRLKPDRRATAQSNCCLSLSQGKPNGNRRILWSSRDVACEYASPIVCEGHAYFLTKVGIIHCLDLETGKECYAERLKNPCWATPIAVNGRIYCFGKEGITTVLASGDEFEVLATNSHFFNDASRSEEKLTTNEGQPKEQAPVQALGKTVYGAAVVDGAILIRTGTDLTCVRKQ